MQNISKTEKIDQNYEILFPKQKLWFLFETLKFWSSYLQNNWGKNHATLILIKYCTYNNTLTGTLVHQDLLLEVSYCSASKLQFWNKLVGFATTSLLGWLIQNECRSWDTFGSFMAKNTYGSPMAKNIYGPPMTKNIYGPQMARNTYVPPMAKYA